MNAFGQRNAVPLSERFSLSPEEVSALTGIGLTSVREAISGQALRAKNHGRRVIVLPDAVKDWLKSLPDVKNDADVA